MKVILARHDQLSAVRSIALATWPSAYSQIISQDQIEYMIEWMYSEASLSHQLNVLNHIFFIAVDEKEIPVGFTSCSTFNKDHIYKLHKLYILPDRQQKGTGKILLDYAIAHAVTNGAQKMILQVNKKNKAVDFYKKNGFDIYEENIFDIGNGFVMDDYLMEKKL
jgi:ribosomal protein S18 acetylase RimI-like enzyme